MTNRESAFSIDFRQMLWEFLIRWKPIVLIGLLSALVLNAVQNNRIRSQAGAISYDGVESAASAANSEAEYIAALEAQLTDEERMAVKQAVASSEKLKGYQDYMQRSVWMRMDPYHLRTLRMSFFIRDTDDITLTTLLQLYREYVSSESFLRELAVDLSLGSDIASAGELVICNDELKEAGNLFTLTIYLPEGVNADQVADVVSDRILTYDVPEIDLMSKRDMFVVDRSLMVTIRGDREDRNDFLYSYENVVTAESMAITRKLDAFTPVQKALYDQYLAKEDRKSVQQGENDGSDTAFAAPSVSTDEKEIRWYPRWLIIGFFLGGMISMFIFFVYWILMARVGRVLGVSSSDKQRIYGILSAGTHPNAFLYSSFFRRLRDKDVGDPARQITSAISAILFYQEAAGIKDLNLLSLFPEKEPWNSAKEQFTQTWKERQGEELPSYHLTMKSADRGEVFEKLNAIKGGVIILTAYGTDSVRDINSICGLLDLKGIPILGFVGME